MNKVDGETPGNNEDRKEIYKISTKMLFLLYVFTFTAWELALTTSHQRSILKIEILVEVLINT